MASLRQELIERYEATGKVGFAKPASKAEAISMIETVVAMYEEPKNSVKEEVVVNIHDLTERIRNFLNTI